jgi:chitinase
MKKMLWIILLLLQLHAYSRQHPYKVIAYYTGCAEKLKQYPLQKLTHLIYSFLRFQNDTLAFRNDQQRDNVMQIIDLKKKYPHLKIMVSIGGWGGCAPCSALFATEEQRNTFAETTVALLKTYHIDGLDLDWEYPAIEGYPGHTYDSSDKEHFTALVTTLRQKMGNEFLLSFAAGGFVQYLEHSIDWVNVIPQVDFVNLMTYDLVGGYSTVTGHHTPLQDYRPGQESIQKCVAWLLQHHVDEKKLIIGAAFYARVWENVLPENNGLYNAGTFKQGVSFKNFNTYFTDSSGFRYYWDKKSKAPYRYSELKQLFATFDDRRSIKAKSKFVRNKKLGGMMFWELSDDKTEEGLLQTMRKKLY